MTFELRLTAAGLAFHQFFWADIEVAVVVVIRPVGLVGVPTASVPEPALAGVNSDTAKIFTATKPLTLNRV